MSFTLSNIEGAGISLRTPHIHQIIEQQPDIAWLEILADNFLVGGGLNKALLYKIRELYPVTMHCVSMSLGSVDPLDFNYLKQVKTLADEFEISWVSDHICFTSAGENHAHDLLPLPYTEEALSNLASRINHVQDYLEQPILLENATRYIQYNHSTLSESEFINELVSRTSCHLLFDVNNAFINQQNLGQSALELINNLPLHAIKEIHLAGYEQRKNILVDTHNNKVSEPVWALYTALQDLIPNTPTQIEWDSDIPDLSVLINETNKAQNIIKNAVKKRIRQEKSNNA